MPLVSDRPHSAEELIAAGEDALAQGEPEAARGLLEQAGDGPLEAALLVRLVTALAQANRFLSRQRDTVQFIETRLGDGVIDDKTRAWLTRARIAALRQVDTGGVLRDAEAALAAADAVGDLESYAGVLADASFAAYRRGDARAAEHYAGLATARQFPPLAAIDALRARMFAETAHGELEKALELSREIRRRRLSWGDHANAANESNNIAEALLELGRPAEAKAESIRAAWMASQAGHRAVERYANVLLAVATAEEGLMNDGIDLLRKAGIDDDNLILGCDTAAALAFWLVERNRAGDATEARDLAEKAVERAEQAGVSHRLTTLLAAVARARFRLKDDAGARAALSRAREAADAADQLSERHLALTMAEVLGPGDPAGSVAKSQARARLLRIAGKRQDPHAYCTQVRLNRRILELSGGVPSDLPPAP
jgi:hypothetical protein